MRTYPEEIHARDLRAALADRLAALGPGTEVEATGYGVHWQCTANRGGRSALVHCFDHGGPQFYAQFRGGDPPDPNGRTRSRTETVEAVAAWLGGAGRDDLHRRFAFVDHRLRQLAAIRADSVAAHPELGPACELRSPWADHHELILRAGDRAARVSFRGEEPEPDAVLSWDDCEQARVRTGDATRRALLLRRWVCDHAPPSAIAQEFPEVEVGPVARFYEEGRPVEGEFLVSWDEIERYFADRGPPDPAPILGLIAAIRRAGFDRTLRAGQSLWTLVVSRSRRHGLRDDQPCLFFSAPHGSAMEEWCTGGMMVSGRVGGAVLMLFPWFEFNPEVDAVLRRLEAFPID